MPLAIAFPLLMETGASGFSVVLIFSRNKSQLCRLSPIVLTATFWLSRVNAFIGMMASNESFRYTTSLGDTFPVAIFEIRRSKSEICFI
ncbi:hypothetical protein D9M72_461590 [compost metagenome]